MRKFFVVACLLLAVMLAGCSRGDAQPSGSDNQTNKGSTVSSEGSEDADTAGTADSVVTVEAIAVDTKYGKLYFQEQWEEHMRVEVTSDDTSVIVAFQAEIDEVVFPLFQFIIGAGEGEPVAQITDDQGTKRDVFVNMEELAEFSSLTEGELDRLYAMQEDINFIIDNLE